MVKEPHSGLETLINRVQILYHLAYNAVNTQPLVLHPLREVSNSLNSITWFPNRSADQDDTMYGTWLIVHTIKAGQLQSGTFIQT